MELPLPANKIQLFSDGNDDYTHILKEYYTTQTCVDYGQLVKIREKGRVVDKEKRVIFGSPDPDEIETTQIENFNGILRERIGRLVRKTKCISKRRPMLENAIEFFQCYWNFIKPASERDTPAMLEGLTDKRWSWDEFLYFHIKYS